jgi:hypothetical protein
VISQLNKALCLAVLLTLPKSKYTNPVVEDLVHLASNPASLRHLARHVVRRQLFVHSGGTSIIPAVFKLHYPPALQQYLLLSDVRRYDISSAPPHHYNCEYHYERIPFSDKERAENTIWCCSEHLSCKCYEIHFGHIDHEVERSCSSGNAFKQEFYSNGEDRRVKGNTAGAQSYGDKRANTDT